MIQSHGFRIIDAFEPAAVDEMAAAFSDICRLLNVRADHSELMEVIASDVIRRARSGACDAATIRNLILASRTTFDFFVSHGGDLSSTMLKMENPYENRSAATLADPGTLAVL